MLVRILKTEFSDSALTEIQISWESQSFKNAGIHGLYWMYCDIFQTPNKLSKYAIWIHDRTVILNSVPNW